MRHVTLLSFKSVVSPSSGDIDSSDMMRAHAAGSGTRSTSSMRSTSTDRKPSESGGLKMLRNFAPHSTSPDLYDVRAWTVCANVSSVAAIVTRNSKFRVSDIRDGSDSGEPLEPCNAGAVTDSIVGLNDRLPPDRRAWSRALLVIDSDGEYELTYEYTK